MFSATHIHNEGYSYSCTEHNVPGAFAGEFIPHLMSRHAYEMNDALELIYQLRGEVGYKPKKELVAANR